MGLEPRSGEILTNEVYKWNPLDDTFDFTGRSYILEKICEKKGISMDEALLEVKRRAAVIDWMNRKNIRNYKDVSNTIRRYTGTPEKFIREEGIEF